MSPRTCLVSLAKELGAVVPVGEATARVFADGAEGPQAELDISGIADRHLS